MLSNRVNQKFCNILVHACLCYIYHMTKTVQAINPQSAGTVEYADCTSAEG